MSVLGLNYQLTSPRLRGDQMVGVYVAKAPFWPALYSLTLDCVEGLPSQPDQGQGCQG